MRSSKRILTAIIAATLIFSYSGCQLKGHSPEDDYVSPYATKDNADLDSVVSEKSNDDKKEEDKTESKKEESKAESKKEESKAESKKEESKAESKKEESKAESKKEESKVESKKEESKVESKKDEESPLYKDMVSLIKDEDVQGYTVCKIAGSNDDHLIIAYGREVKPEDTDTSNLIILDPEGYASELAEKENARIEEQESSRLYSIYKIKGDMAVPEGDLDGYFTTAYISPNSNTLALYYLNGNDWAYGLVEFNGGSAFINYSYSSTLGEDSDSIPPMPGEAVNFSKPNNFDLLKKYK